MLVMPWNLEAVTVRLQESDAQPDASASVIRGARPHPLPAFPNFLIKTLDIAEWELRKLRHDPTDLFTRAVQPALWLVVFGEVFTRIRAIPTGQVRYLDFMAPGILAQSVLFISIFYGITIIWERDLGVIHKFLASPIPRSTIVLGKALSAGLRALPQALIIYTLALLLGVRMNWNPLAILGVILLVMLGAACFSTFSMIIACLLRTRDRVMGIGQVLTMPLFFASNAIYPISIMPSWLQVIARGNPLSYVVDGIRMLMLAGATIDIASLGVDILILVVIAIVLVLICGALYPRIVQ
jgi:ABC-2 type transport system permease protein